MFSGAAGHAQLAEGAPFGAAFPGGVRVAAGDVNGDGIADAVVAMGPGVIPVAGGTPVGGLVRIYSGHDATLIGEGFPFGPASAGGVFVAVGDVDGDGRDELIAGEGAGAHVRIYSLAGAGALLGDLAPYGPAFTGGVRVAAGDVNGDGLADVITAPASGIGTVKLFVRGTTPTGEFFPFAPDFAGGVFVAAGDVNGDGRADIVASTSTGPGHIRVFSGADGGLLHNVGPGLPAGISVAAADLNGDGRADIIGGIGPGGPPIVGVLDGATGGLLASFLVDAAIFGGGILVAAPPSQGIEFTSEDHTTFTTGTAGTFTVTTSAGPTVTSITQTGTLPTGVTFTDNHDGTATLSGTVPTGSGGTFTLTFTAQNAVAPPAQQTFTLRVEGPPQITSANATTFNVGAAGTFAVTTIGFPAPTITATGALPSGVTFVDNSDGTATLSGTPATGTGGTYPLTLTASNGVGTAATQAFTLTVDSAPAFTSAASTTFVVSTPSSFAITTAGDPAVSTITQTGTLPTGITYLDNGNGTATLSGTPAAGTSGTYALTLTASNGVGADAVQNFTLTVQVGPAITSPNTTTFQVGGAYSFTVTTTGLPVPSLTAIGTLPAGITFTDNHDGTATLAGMAAVGTGGLHTFTIEATNGLGSPAMQPFTLEVDEAPVVTSADNATFTVGAAGAFTVTTSGFPASFISISGVPLPVGVTFTDNGDGTGTLGGIPAVGAGGTYAIQFLAANLAGVSPTQNFTLTVNEAPSITSGATATFDVGVASSFTITTTGFPSPTISTTSALPGGITLVDNADGTASLSGTAATGTGGTHMITLEATNTAGSAAPQTFTLTIQEAPTITSAATHTFVVGAAGTFTVTTDGFPAGSIALGGVALPSALSFVDNGNGTGTLSGTPAVGTGAAYAITFTATNGAGSSPAQSFSLLVNEPPAITSGASTTFDVGTAGTFTVTTSGFPRPAITTSSTLPTGIALVDNGDGTATLGGTAAAGTGGVHTLTINASNVLSAATPQTFTLTVRQAPSITSVNTTTFVVGTPGTFIVSATGFPAPAIARGGVALPSGVTYVDNGNGTGTLSGPPAAGTGGSYAITFTATNTVGSTPAQAFALVVNEAPAISSGASASFDIGQAGTFGVTTTGFPAPAITTTGPLPSGVALVDHTNGTATLSGTPAAGTAGNYPFTIDANNGVGSPFSQNFVLTVTCPTITVSPAAGTLPQGIFGDAYSQTFTASGGTPPRTFAISAGAIPASLALGAGGGLSGTLTNTGDFGFTVTASDTNLCTGSTAYTLEVIPDANPESFAGVGNTQLAVSTTVPSTPTVSLTGSVVTNDLGPGTLEALPGTITTTNGGSVVMNTNGSFSYTPAPGVGGTDAFVYTLKDGNNKTAPGTVSILLTGMVWYVNSSGASGNGTSGSPFNDMDGAEGASVASSTIFVHTGGATTPDAIVLKANQTLWGQGTTFTLGNLTIAAGGKPGLSGTVTIGGSNVTISSLNITTTGATSLTNSGAATGLTVKNDVVVSATNATAVLLSGVDSTAGGFPNFGINFTSIAASNGANGISLTNVNTVSGSFTVTGDGASDPANATRGRTTVAQGGGTLALNSGGTIENVTGIGVLLNNSKNVTLRNVRVQNNSGDGIFADGTTGLTLDNVLVSGHADARGLHGPNLTDLSLQHVDISSNATDVGLEATSVANVNFGERPPCACKDGLKGTVTVANSTFHTTRDNVWLMWEANAANVNMTVTNSRFANSVVAMGINIQASGTANVSTSVSGSLFENIKSIGYSYGGNDSSGGGTLTVNNNLFNNVGVDIAGAHQGLSKTVAMNFSGNTTKQTLVPGSSTSIGAITGGVSNALTLVNATLASNFVGNAAVPDSGSDLGVGLGTEARGAGTINVRMHGNTVREIKQTSGVYASGNSGSGTLNLTMTANDVQTANDALGYVGIELVSGGAGGSDATNICANFSGGNTAFIGGPTTSGATSLVLAAASEMNLFNYFGTTNNTSQIATFLDSIALTVSPNPDSSWVVLGTPGATIQGTAIACPTPP